MYIGSSQKQKLVVPPDSISDVDLSSDISDSDFFPGVSDGDISLDISEGDLFVFLLLRHTQ